MQIAELTALRGTCDRAQVGAIAVKNNRIICSGYNGSPSGLAHCSQVGHLFDGNHCIRTIHAEMNLICQAAKMGISLNDATIYCTHQPCFFCLQHLINVGVLKIYYKHSKPDLRIPDEYYNHIVALELK
jgi:dCMP deaminase